MSVFHSLTVKKVQRETHDTVSISFNIPEQLQSNFNYLPGQYLTLRLNIGGEQLNRSYSLCSNPFEDEDLAVAVKTVEGGKASGWLNNSLNAGDLVEVMEPMGNFTLEPSVDARRDLVFFGGGSGITPIMSMIRAALQKEPNSMLTLFYGNRDAQSIIFNEHFKQLENESEGRLKIVHVLNEASNGITEYTGLMDKQMCLRLLREQTSLSFSNTQFFLCGPSPMMSEVISALETHAIPAEKIHKEYFTAKQEEDKQEGSVGEATGEALTGNTTVQVKYDGDTIEFEMNPDTTILEAALDAGYDPPYSCMVAACCTCRAKLMGGSVKMDDRESLTDEEIDEGYVLTCQAHPTSHGVVLDYDE